MKKMIVVFIFIFFLGPCPVRAAENKTQGIAPTDNDGRPWRIGYVEGGPYRDYVEVLKYTIAHLAKMNWIEPGLEPCVEKAENTLEIWSCLNTNAKSRYLTFPENAYWSADWDPEKRLKNKEDIINRLNTEKDIDMVIAIGTWAGQDMANDLHTTPTIICSTSNAIASGIIKSAADSGRDYIHARVDPDRYARQVRFFHDLVGFKVLGVVLEGTLEGRSYAGLDQIERVAKEKGFKIVECQAVMTGVDLKIAEQAVAECYERIAPLVDAFYITNHRGVTKENMSRILKPMFEHRLPNFAQGTLYQVRYGAMMSMAQPDLDYAGKFYAETIAKILGGIMPRDIRQVHEDPHAISINLEAAEKIGFDFPMEILGGADEIVKKIEIFKEE